MTSILAHRGAAQSAPENSLDAFEAAAHLGADGVELDVRRTADGCLVLHHDIEIGGLGPISAIRRGDLPSHVPTLEQALELCTSLDLEVNVEVKSESTGSSHDPEQRCARESAELCAQVPAQYRIVVSSFSVPALAAVRESAPDLVLAWLVGVAAYATAGERPWSEGVLGTLGLEGVHPSDAMVDAHYLRRAHDDGLAVRVWTVDDPARIEQLSELGVEAVITNDVAVALRAVSRA